LNNHQYNQLSLCSSALPVNLDRGYIDVVETGLGGEIGKNRFLVKVAFVPRDGDPQLGAKHGNVQGFIA
jgi:hypothetical protein